MGADDGLHHDHLDLLPESRPVTASGLQVFPESAETPLVALELIRVSVLLECLAVLVHGVVSEMDELVPQVSTAGVERLGGEPHQSILVEIEPAGAMMKVSLPEIIHTPDGINAGEEDVQPQVELEPVH